MTILAATDLSKSFGKTSILSNINLSIRKGESIAITGKSGSGKTTLLHILGLLEKPDSGTLSVGNNLDTLQALRHHIGFVFQSFHLLEDFTTLQNVLMPARIARQDASREKGIQLLAQVGLQNKADLPVKLLSGGEKQRAAIARALCNNPSIILADEPTGNLDRENARLIAELLLSLNRALILVTHDPELAALCQTRYVLQDGRLS